MLAHALGPAEIDPVIPVLAVGQIFGNAVKSGNHAVRGVIEGVRGAGREVEREIDVRRDLERVISRVHPISGHGLHVTNLPLHAERTLPAVRGAQIRIEQIAGAAAQESAAEHVERLLICRHRSVERVGREI